MAKKKQVDNNDLCAMGLTDPVERKIMATSMKAGQDQINFLREQEAKENQEEEQ